MRALVVASLAVSSLAFAAGAQFEAQVSSQNITIDQTVQLTVSLGRDGAQALESYRPPQMPDFDVLHNGTSQQIESSFINGRQSVRMVEEHVYVLRAKKKGALTIGPATAKVGGQELRTKPLTVTVAPPSKNALSPVLPQAPGATVSPGIAPPVAPEGMRGHEDLFVDSRADKTKVYVGEQVLAEWRLFTQTDILNYRTLQEPKHEDFWSENLVVPGKFLAKDRQVVNGREYAAALLMKKALFPLKAGKLTITSLEAEATTLENAFSPTASGIKRSAPLTIEVRPLPVQGRPLTFESSNVGDFTVAASVDRLKVSAGEAITWTVVVRGAGNVRNMKLPTPEHMDGWKVYDPTVKETVEPGDVVRGEKKYVFLLMPERGGTLTVPPAEFPYFDPQKGEYQIAKSEPFTVTVVGDPGTTATHAPSGPADDNLLAQQIRPIRNRQGVRSEIGSRLWRGPFAIALLATPPGLWLGILIVDAIRRRLSQETPRARRRRARRTARRRMRVAEYHIKGLRPSAFFGECARIIYEHLEYALNQKVESLTLTELRGFLETKGFPKETAEMVVRELETCDFARFAPSASGPGEMRAALRRVKTLLGWIEKVRAFDEREAA